MYDKIKQEIISAMKEKDTLKLQTLRGIKGDADLEHINKGLEINDDLLINVLSRGIKTRKESIEEFKKGGRDDLIEKTNKEIELLQSYLPKQLTHDELTKIIDEVFTKVAPKSEKEMGLIMKEVTPLVKGKADMKEVSTLIKEKLSNL
ncbi:MAG: GatB/YqeY domain-containing protein [Bacilli bacterium]|nr:GatB/YqeY domain-containing protein [Bacilli bacterium]